MSSITNQPLPRQPLPRDPMEEALHEVALISGCEGITSRILYHLRGLEWDALQQFGVRKLLANFEVKDVKQIDYYSFLQDIDTIDDTVIKYYQEAHALSGKSITPEQALLECLKAKRIFKACGANDKELTSITISKTISFLGPFSITQSLVEELKKHVNDIQNISLDNINFSDNGVNTSSLFAEFVSTASYLKKLIINNSKNFNALLPIGSSCEDVFLSYCPDLTHAPHLQYANKLKNFMLQNCDKISQAPIIPQNNTIERFGLSSLPALVNPPDLQYAHQLETLTLSYLPITQAPVIPLNNALRSLLLPGCLSMTNPPDLQHVTKLKKVVLNGCLALLNPPNLSNCKSIEEVYMRGCPIASLPQGLPDGVLVASYR
jgi:hypothetical protein